MKLLFIIRILVVSLIGLPSCKKSCSNDGYVKYYKGYHEIRILPDVDSLRVSDSLYFEIKIPYHFLNIRDSTYVDASNISLPSFYTMPFHESFINGIRKPNDINVFTLIQKTGKCKLVIGKGIICNFLVSDIEYKLLFFLIPKKKGIISLEFGSLLGERDRGCTDCNFIPKILNPNKRHNLHHQYLIENGEAPIWITNPETYIIKVVE